MPQIDNLIARVVFIGGILQTQSKTDVGQRVRTDCHDGAEDHLGQWLFYRMFHDEPVDMTADPYEARDAGPGQVPL